MFRQVCGWLIAGLLLAGSLPVARAGEPAEPSDGPPLASGCTDGCESCPSTVSPWEVKSGFVLLQRSGLPSQDLAKALNDGPPFHVVDADQLGFNFHGGPDLTILHHGDLADVEFRWFQVQDSMAQTPTAHDSLGFGLPFRYLLGVAGNGTDISAQYLSSLSSFELNFKRPVTDRITLLAGFRFVDFDETMAFNATVGGAAIPPIFVRSFNDLYGFQLGSDITLWDRGGPFRLLETGKAGIYGNWACNRADDAGERPGYVDSASTGHAAFLGEIGVAATYQITSRLTARVGYQVTWLDGVALASQQEPRLDPAHDPTDFGKPSVATGGTAFYHGVVGGFDFRF
jgi:hypothetical protein